MKIKCHRCDNFFYKKVYNQRFCSNTCQNKDRLENKRKSRTKICNYCNNEFYDKSKFNAKKYCCKKCHNDKITCARYEISRGEFNILSNIKSCELCNKELNNGLDRCIDHCHETGIVRGMLCAQCNKGLGLLGDTSKSIEKALNYLKRDFVLDETNI